MAVLCRLSYSSGEADDRGWMRRLPLIALALLAACSRSPLPTSPPSTAPLFSDGSAIIETEAGRVTATVRIAETEAARERGLMGVRHLDPEAGMAFLFDQPTTATFHMKDTLIPLAIAFWDREGRIVAIEQMVPCRADPCPLTRAPSPVTGALETNPGFFGRHSVRVGDRIRLGRDRV